MDFLNNMVQCLAESATLAVKTRATELKKQGKEIFDLSTGEPDFDTPDHVKAAAQRAMTAGKTKYTPVAGIPELREAIASKFKTENNISATAANVIVTNGGKQALSALFAVCLEPGDEVIIPAPYWVSYVPMVEMTGAKAVIVNTDPLTGYKLTPAALKAALTARSKIFVFNSPSNPTGVTYSKTEQQALGAVLKDHNLLVVSDEVYEKVVFDHFEFCSFAAAVPELADRTVTVNAFSKSFSMTGWRVGYATGPGEIIAALAKYQGQTTSNVCSIAQWAALAALQEPQDFLLPHIANFRRRVQLAMDIIAETPGLAVPVVPQGAFYLFVRIEEALKQARGKFNDSLTMANFLLEAGTAVVPGVAFGDDGAFRISVACADQNLENGLKNIQKALQSL